MRIVIRAQDVNLLEASQIFEDSPNNKKRQGPKLLICNSLRAFYSLEIGKFNHKSQNK